jgi:signal transduction histidine kinase
MARRIIVGTLVVYWGRRHAASPHLFHIAQESCNNTIKHAQVKNAQVLLQPVEQGVMLRIQDYGVGIWKFLPEELVSDKGKLEDDMARTNRRYRDREERLRQRLDRFRGR